MSNYIEFSQLSEHELLDRIKDDYDYLGVVYKKCKDNCLNFMRSMTKGTYRDDIFEDIYQDANLVLLEKIIDGNFILTASFQTYLNSVCRNQLLKKYNNKLKIVDYNNSEIYSDNITDILEEIPDSQEKKFLAIERALEDMKLTAIKCYELIISYWYYRKSMSEIATSMGYTNDKNAKHQKSRCQKKLKNIVFNIIRG